MRTMKIVSDSSANTISLDAVNFASAPLKVMTDNREFVDNEQLNIDEMIDYFDSYKGKSKTSCPNPADWLDAFGDCDDVFCVAITSGLSGSYNAACIAKQMYEGDHPGRRVFVIDSLSAGPELQLIIEKLQELIAEGNTYDEICSQIQDYVHNTGLLFMLESLKNFAANGRVSPAVAKIVGLLGIRIVGKASDAGTLEPMDKCRGEAKSLDKIVTHLKEFGLQVGKVRIAHCRNQTGAARLENRIHSVFPKADVKIMECRGLCSYYAESGGLLVGFEKC